MSVTIKKKLRRSFKIADNIYVNKQRQVPRGSLQTVVLKDFAKLHF